MSKNNRDEVDKCQSSRAHNFSSKLEIFFFMQLGFGVLAKQDPLKGLTAPLHPGAIKYFKEAGLLR
jgi:TRAP-type uncharacterized transport system substrate-binding protein